MYNSRCWLNNKKSSSTGSIVCFSGRSNYSFASESTPAYSRFVELSDCHSKVRIHQARFETKAQYLRKIDKMIDALIKYRTSLENENS